MKKRKEKPLKMHYEKYSNVQVTDHLRFAICGKYEMIDNKKWINALTTDKLKVTCKNCMRRLGISYRAFAGDFNA